MKRYLLGMMLFLVSVPVFSAIEVYQFDTQQQEKLYQTMIDELRCLVCQNQNLSASNAALAKDLRQQTYQMIMKGKTQEEIVSYMTQRYGDFVLYRPPFNNKTLFLWGGPLVLLFLGLFTLYRSLKSVNASQIMNLRNDKQHLSLGGIVDEEH